MDRRTNIARVLAMELEGPTTGPEGTSAENVSAALGPDGSARGRVGPDAGLAFPAEGLVVTADRKPMNVADNKC
jgi:hypothetical protein